MKIAAVIVPLFLASTCAAKSTTLRRVQAATYAPGDFSDGAVVEDSARGTKVFLSNGLVGRAIAHDSEPVIAADGTQLSPSYHVNADGGGIIPKTDGSDGYYYVSNSEIGEYPEGFDPNADRSTYANDLIGGVYSLEFNKDHELVGYKQVLKHTAGNCAGGVTPWNTWISCEERRKYGRCWQVDPSGEIEAEPTGVTPYLIDDFGSWEAFAWDSQSNPPRGYVTNDEIIENGAPSYRGAIVRFTPDNDALECLSKDTDAERWCALNSGTHEYLKLIPDESKFEWVTNIEDATPQYYQGSEGLHVENDILTFATIVDRSVFRLQLNYGTYIQKPTPHPQEPDNLRIFGDVLYLCTDGDHEPNDGVWAWDNTGAYQVIKEEGHNYPAGVAFSPDGKIMYVSFYGEATWQFQRLDGLRFDDETAGAVYEADGGLDA